MTSTCGNVTLRFWHGGKFSEAKTGELVYLGGQGKTVLFDPDELCYFDIMKSATESGQYETVSGVYYLIPGLAMAEGLRKVVDDGSVIEMGELALKYRTIDLYVLHQSDDPCLSPTPQPKSATMPTNNQPLIKPKKMTPMRAPPKPSGKSPRKSPRLAAVIFEGHSLGKADLNTSAAPQKIDNFSKEVELNTSPTFEPDQNKILATNPKSPPKTSQIPLSQNFISESLEDVFLDSYDWVDPRPESPIPLNQLISEPSDDDEDSLYEPEEENTSEEEDIEGVDAEEVQDEFEVEENGEELFAAEELLAGESDNDDEEYYVARERVRTCTTRLNEIAQQLQVEAAEGRLKCAGGEKNRDRTTDQGYESEYYDSEDDMQTPPNSDEEIDVGRRGRRSTLVGSETDFAKFQWKVGQRFATRDGFKQAVAKYGIMQGRNVSVVVSNKTRRQELGVKCVKDCPFYLYASWHSQKASYLVKRVVSEHKCHRNMKKNRQFKSTWVANEMLEVFKARPHWPAKEIKDTIKRAYKVLVNRQFAYKVKYNAHKLLHGSMHEHYQKLGRYMAAMEASSPNSVVDLVVDTVKGVNPPVFQRLFTCFEGLQKGWKEGCRKVICVDAAFLKTFLGGQILAAVGRDANEQMFPIAWAVVEGENNTSWEWFFNHLKVCLGLGDGEGYAIISDEHQAILNGVNTVLPMAEHRHCARHVFAHWHKHFRGDEMKLQFWKIAKAYNMTDYNDALDELSEKNAAAATSFKSYNPKCFCRAFMQASIKSDAITNNMAETFNGYIINARTKHLIYMMEDIRVALMQRLVAKRKEMEKHTSMLCPRIQSMLDKEKHKAAYCEVIPSTDKIFNVNHNLDQLVVNLENKTCTCRKWDLTGVPCCHTIACIFFLNMEAENFVDECYRRDVYLRSYGGSIPAIEGERHWPRVECNLTPPPIKIGPGRPRKNRIRDPFEDPKRPGTLSKHGMEMTCTLCHVKGHNKRGCPKKGSIVPAEPAPKKARGRPRKDASTSFNQQPQPNANHHSVTAHPTQLGRGGRMILTGEGARSGATGRGNGRGNARGSGGGIGGSGKAVGGAGRGSAGRTRGRGKNQAPVGIGVIMGGDGSQFLNVMNGATNKATQSSQTSAIVHPTQ